jgi:NTE family protein
VLRTGRVADAIRASAAIPGLLTPETIDGRVLVDGGIVNPIPVDVARELGADVVIAVSVLDVFDEAHLTPPAEGMQALAAQWLAKLFPRESQESQGRALRSRPADLASAVDDLGLIEIMSRASRIVQARLAEERLRANPPEVLIRIPLPGITLFEFDRSSEAVLAGRTAAVAALPAIRAMLERADSIQGRMGRILKGKP